MMVMPVGMLPAEGLLPCWACWAKLVPLACPAICCAICVGERTVELELTLLTPLMIAPRFSSETRTAPAELLLSSPASERAGVGPVA